MIMLWLISQFHMSKSDIEILGKYKSGIINHDHNPRSKLNSQIQNSQIIIWSTDSCDDHSMLRGQDVDKILALCNIVTNCG